VGKPIQNGVGLNDYMIMQTQEDALAHPGIRSYAKNGMVKEVTPGLVDGLIEAYRSDPRVALFSHTAGGAVGRVDELGTAFAHRNAQTMLVFASLWEDPAQDEEAIALTREWYNHLEPYMGGYYQNIEFEIDEAAGNYGPAYSRLAQATFFTRSAMATSALLVWMSCSFSCYRCETRAVPHGPGLATSRTARRTALGGVIVPEQRVVERSSDCWRGQLGRNRAVESLLPGANRPRLRRRRPGCASARGS